MMQYQSSEWVCDILGANMKTLEHKPDHNLYSLPRPLELLEIHQITTLLRK
jgi:hypothetical protein